MLVAATVLAVTSMSEAAVAVAFYVCHAAMF